MAEDQTKDKKICIAKILTAHGVRGLVKLRVFLEDIADLETYNPLTTLDDRSISIKIKNSLKGDDWVAEVIGISDRNDAEKLRGVELFINRNDLPEQDEDAFYYEDLIGLETRDIAGNKIGMISEVDNYGAGDVVKIKPLSGASFFLPVAEPYLRLETVADGFVTIEHYEEFMG